jgi:hypothetical protein
VIGALPSNATPFMVLGVASLVAFAARSAVAAFPAVGLIVVYAAVAIILAAAATLFAIKVAPMLVKFKFKGFTLPMMSYPDCEACPCDVDDLQTDEIQGNIFGGGDNQQAKIGKYTVNSRTNGSILADTNSNELFLSAPNTNLCNFDANGDQILQSGYPTYFCTSSEPITLIKHASVLFATARAVNVFPVPGGP